MAVNVLRAACAVLWIAVAASAAGTPPPRWERLAELVGPTMLRLEQLRGSDTAPLPPARVLARCAERVDLAVAACTRARRPPPFGCAARLADTALGLAAAADTTTDAGAWIAFVAADTARLALLLGTLERDREACVRPPADTAVPAVLGWRAGGTVLDVEPARPLPPGVRHRLVIAPDLAVVATTPSLDAGGRLLPTPAPAAAVPAVAAYAARIGRAAARASGVTTRPVLSLHLARPVSLRDARALSAAFVPIRNGDATPGAIVVTTRGAALAVTPPTTTAGSARASTRVLAADEREALGLGGPALQRVQLRLGEVASHDPETGGTRPVPYLVAIPRAHARSDAVVLLLDGLGGSAGPFLRVRGASLLAAGATLVAMDLPAHGMRADGAPFLDPHDPTVLARRLRTAVGDVLALAARLRTPGALAPDLPVPGAVRVLGYSIGAGVASVALALDPALGATVLVAPPGDLADFLAVSTSAAFGEPLLRCLAGRTLGGACGTDVPCTAGACVFNPVLLPLLETRTAVRTLLAAVDPQTRARAIAGPGAARPVLLQVGGRDGIIPPENTLWLAAALGADLTCTRRRAHPQTACRFPAAGHEVVWNRDAHRQADAFLLSGGEALAPSGAPLAAR